MQKLTKEIITPQYIKKELKFFNGANIKSSAFFMLMCCPFTLLLLPLALAYASNPTGVIPFLSILIFIGMLMLVTSPIWLLGLTIVYLLCERKQIDRGRYTVTIYTVSEKKEIYRRHGGYQELIYFRESNKPIRVNHTEFQLADISDGYYVVTYSKKPSNILLYFSCERYEYKD